MTPFPNPRAFDILIGTHTEKEDYLNDKFGYGLMETNSRTAGNAQCITVETKKGRERFLWFERVNTEPEELGLVVHEVLHFVFAELKDAGIKHSEESEEIYTYLLQHIVVNLFAALEKPKKKTKKR